MGKSPNINSSPDATKRKANEKVVPLHLADSDSKLNHSNENKERTNPALFPDVEADYIVGDFIEHLFSHNNINKNKQHEEISEENHSLKTKTAETDENSGIFTISDSVIESFLQTKLIDSESDADENKLQEVKASDEDNSANEKFFDNVRELTEEQARYSQHEKQKSELFLENENIADALKELDFEKESIFDTPQKEISNNDDFILELDDNFANEESLASFVPDDTIDEFVMDESIVADSIAENKYQPGTSEDMTNDIENHIEAEIDYSNSQIDSQYHDSESDDENENIFYNGIKYYREKLYEDAIRVFKEVIEINPDSKDVCRILGNAYFKNNMYTDAIKIYEQLKTIDPQDIYSYENLGMIYAEQGDYKSAAKEWQTLLTLHPGRTDIKDKLNKVERLIKADAEDEQTNLSAEKVNLMVHGIEYYKNRDYESAIKIFKQAINDFPDLKEAYSFLGNAYFRNKMFREALLAYEKVKQIDKGDIIAYENVGVIYAKQGAFDQAVNEWKIILQFNPQRNDIENKIEKVMQLMA